MIRLVGRKCAVKCLLNGVETESLFKEKAHAILLKIFEVQDRYADLSAIISGFKKY